MIEGVGVAEHVCHGLHTRYCPPCHVVRVVVVDDVVVVMMMMDRRVVGGTRMRQARGIDGEDTNERHLRVALLTIPTGDILIEGVRGEEHVSHGCHARNCPPCRVVRVVVVVHGDDGSPYG